MDDAARFLVVCLVLGWAAQPLARRVLAPLPGGAAGLARPFGLLLAAVPLWLAGSLHVLPFTVATAWLAAAAVAVAGGVVALRARWRGVDGSRPNERASEPPASRGLLIGAELVFVATFALGALVVAHVPDVWGTEKPMDMSFVSALRETRYFPPNDLWLSDHSLNYYYLGQYLTVFVARLADVGPTEGYNLSIALVWALGASAAFGLGASAVAALRARAAAAPPWLGGALATLLVIVGGNVEGLRRLLLHDGALERFEWFAASRRVPGGINDFPAFEALLGDLHAHVIAVPFTLLGLAFVLQALLDGPRLAWPRVLAAGLVVGALYPINAWSFPVVLGLLAAGGVLRGLPGAVRPALRRAAPWAAAVAGASIAIYLPFWLGYSSGGAEGVSFVPERRGLAAFVADLLAMYGFALVPSVLALGWVALTRTGAVPRALVAGAGLLAVLTLAPVDDLGGPALELVLLGAALWAAVVRPGAERYAFLLLAGGLACTLVGEVVYLRDAFDDGPFYRMNTVFKFGFQTWLLVGIAAAVLLAAAIPRVPRAVAWPGLALLAAAALAWPIAASIARTQSFAGPARLDGLRWLDELAPGDRPAIAWLREHTHRDAVVLEATGPEYSPRGHSRVATFSGRPTVVGWAAHELFWRGIDRAALTRRIRDVQALYETTDLARTRALLARYEIAYAVIGPTERATYSPVGFAKFARLGRRVFARDGTTIYRVGS